MKYLCEVNEIEIAHILETIKFIHDETFDEKFPYSGNFAICSNIEDWERECQPCCGTHCSAIYLPTGKRVFFCFDYGH